MTLRRIPEATLLIVGPDGAGMKDPQGWVLRKIRRGEFKARKIGRSYFMTDEHIRDAIASLEDRPPQAVPTVEPDPSGLTVRSRRRLRSAS